MAGAGGSDEFRVEGRTVPIPPADKEELGVEGEGGGGEGAGGFGPDVLDSETAGAVIEATVSVLGKALVLATKIPEADFTMEEVEALKKLWTPLMPTLSPLSAAIIGTVVIVGGKMALIMVEKGKNSGKIPQTAEGAGSAAS